MKYIKYILAIAILFATTVVANAQSGPVPVTELPTVVTPGNGPAPAIESPASVERPAPAGYVRQTVMVGNSTRTVYVRDPRYRKLAGRLTYETSRRKIEDSKIRSYIADERQVRKAVDNQLDRKIDAVAATATTALTLAQTNSAPPPAASSATGGSQKGSKKMGAFQIVMICFGGVLLVIGAVFLILYCLRGGGRRMPVAASTAANRKAHGLGRPKNAKQNGSWFVCNWGNNYIEMSEGGYEEP